MRFPNTMPKISQFIEMTNHTIQVHMWLICKQQKDGVPTVVMETESGDDANVPPPMYEEEKKSWEDVKISGMIQLGLLSTPILGFVQNKKIGAKNYGVK